MGASNTSVDDYLLAVGRGLRAWSGVENAIFNLFLQVSGSPDDRAIRIFNAVNSFDVRLSILNELMLLELHEHADRSIWVKLALKLAKFYKKRHALAHFDIVTSHTGTADGSSNVTAHFQPFFTIGRFLTEEPTYLRLPEIEHRIEKFDELGAAVRYFWGVVHRRRRQLPESDVLVPDLIQHFRSSADQSPAE